MLRVGTGDILVMLKAHHSTMTARRSPATVVGTKPLLSVSEAALLLGMDRSTLYRAIRQGDADDIPMARVGRRMRIPRRAIERLLAGGGGNELNGDTDGGRGHCPTCGSGLLGGSEAAEGCVCLPSSLTRGLRDGERAPCVRRRRGRVS